MKTFASVLIFFVTLLACAESRGDSESTKYSAEFRSYWFGGTAELNRYELKQSRYGELHSGHSVLIFVTEEFLTDKQVKYEGGNHPKRTPILKLNSTSKFLTGVYPYSLMNSIFAPLDRVRFPRSLKVAFSAQEWCGHVYAQYNLRGDSYRVKAHSYFMKEGDQDLDLGNVALEDELWVLLRLNPDSIATGKRSLVPGAQFLRLRHLDIAAYPAVIGRSASGASSTLRVEYPGLARTLEIDYQTKFPHAILGWRDRHQSGWGPGAKLLTTVARRTHVAQMDYWSRNQNKDRVLRKKLGL